MNTWRGRAVLVVGVAEGVAVIVGVGVAPTLAVDVTVGVALPVGVREGVAVGEEGVRVGVGLGDFIRRKKDDDECPLQPAPAIEETIIGMRRSRRKRFFNLPLGCHLVVALVAGSTLASIDFLTTALSRSTARVLRIYDLERSRILLFSVFYRTCIKNCRWHT